MDKKSSTRDIEEGRTASEILPAMEQPGHSHRVADYQISRSALEELLVAFAEHLTAERSGHTADGLAETLRRVADRVQG